ncbi:MAG: EF-P lysine aminoacylase GenX [Gammaproteobacteria bacterium]|nr:EF-P lysine aminoacylase GenX [Gammaproteobacteria bacterium]
MTDWRPTASLEVLRLRARMLAHIRDFFAQRAVLEVETPVLSAAGIPDPHLRSLVTRYTGPGATHGRELYLHSSPEFAMKRLLAAGSGAIYQLGKVFRDGEAGRLHNPEFTLLEWYRIGYDHRALMSEVAELVTGLLSVHIPLAATESLSYQEVFQRHAGIDPHRAGHEQFAACAARHGIHPPDGLAGQHDAALWRDLLLSHVVEPRLGVGRLTFVYDYPASQAALARVRPGDPPLASRFELYVNGIELANGFHELADAAEQRTRFERQLHARAVAAGLPAVPLDERLLAALTAGLPDCAGVALGFDRLAMLAAGARTLAEVLAFPVDRA